MAFAAVLVLLGILSILGFSFLFTLAARRSAANEHFSTLQSHYLAESAANHALWRLLNEPAFPASATVYDMHSLAGGRYGYKVRRHTNTTFATIATVGAVGNNVSHHSYVLYVKPPPAAGILTAYGSLTLSFELGGGGWGSMFDSSPKYRVLDTAGWHAEAVALNLNPALTEWVALAGNPISGEAVMGNLTNDGHINLAVWDGAAWGNAITFTTTASPNYKSFDVAYESISGEALVMGRTDGGSSPKYTLWNGATWIHDPPLAAPDYGGSETRYLGMASHPFSNEILIAILDSDKNTALFRWDGVAFSNLGIIETNATTNDPYVVHVTYEQQSGHALIVWGRFGSLTAKYRIWNGAALEAQGELPSFAKQTALVRAVPDPTSDYIAVAAVDSANDLHVAIWDGGAWIDHREIETKMYAHDQRCFDIAWESSGNEILVTWSKAQNKDIKFYRWTKGTALADGTIANGPDFGTYIALVQLLPITTNDNICFLGVGSTNLLKYTLWNGDFFDPDPIETIATVNLHDTMVFDLTDTN